MAFDANNANDAEGRTEKMAREEEVALFKRYAEAEGSEKYEIRDEIFGKYYYLVDTCVAKNKPSGLLTYGDIRAAAGMGLVRAIDLFNPDLGNTFSTYATASIKGAITNVYRVRNTSVIPPRDLASTAKKANEASGRYYVEHGEYPTVQQLAEMIDEPAERIQEALEYKTSVSLNTPINDGSEDGEGDGRTLIDLIAGEDRYDDIDMAETVREEVEKLSDEEKRIVRGLYYDKKTQTEVAAELGWNQMAVSRVNSKILERLKKAIYD